MDAGWGRLAVGVATPRAPAARRDKRQRGAPLVVAADAVEHQRKARGALALLGAEHGRPVGGVVEGGRHAQPAHVAQVGRAAGARHRAPARQQQLRRRRAHASAHAVNEDTPAGTGRVARQPHRRERRAGHRGHGRRVVQAQRRRDRRRLRLLDGNKLRRAALSGWRAAIDAVADLEARAAGTHLLDDARNILAENAREAVRQDPAQVAGALLAVCRVDRGGVDPHEDLSGRAVRSRHCLDLEDAWRAVGRQYGGPHNICSVKAARPLGRRAVSRRTATRAAPNLT